MFLLLHLTGQAQNLSEVSDQIEKSLETAYEFKTTIPSIMTGLL